MSNQRSRVVRLGWALCGGLLALQARAAAPTLEQLQHMPAPMRAEIIKRLMGQQAERRASANSSRGLDMTPPVLTAFNAGTHLNADDINAQIQFSLSISDDFSGVDYLYVHVSSPSGHQQSWTGTTLYGERKFSGKVAMSARPYAEVGAWFVQEVFGADLAGNFFYCESTCLSKLGNVQFAVAASISDTQAPTLAWGKLLTTRVGLSKAVRGTEGRMPHIAAQLSFTDLGQSGVAEVGASFCRLGVLQDCIFIGGPLYGRDLGNSSSLIVGTSLDGQSPGVYELDAVWVSDRAGNTSSYKSILFGGETDFRQFFPSTAITLVP